jgi:T5SS/PEP-CTERM-associated repeat protein
MDFRIAFRITALVTAAMWCATPASAQTNSVATGNWSDPLTWSAGEPTDSIQATLNGGFTVTVDQAGETANNLDIGTASGQVGHLKIGTGGALFIANTHTPPNLPCIRVGQAAGSTGTLDMTDGNVYIDGGAGTDPGIGELIVGDNGTGTMNLSGGDFHASDEIWIGAQPTGTGTVNVTGGNLQADGRSILVGFNGKGNLNVSGTATVKANFDMLVGFLAGATSTINQSGGTIDANFLFTNFDNPGVSPGSTVTITQTGGTYTAHIAYVLGRGPGTTTVTHSGGAIVCTTELNDGDMVVSDGVGNTSTYNISGTATATVGRDFIIGTFEGSNGTVNQTGGTITAANNLRIGADGVGLWNLNGGAVNAKNIFLGDFDTSFGTLKITSGTLTLSGDLSVGGALASNAAPDRVEPNGSNGPQGQALAAHGTLTVSGTGATINVAGNFLANPSDKSSFRSDPFAPGGNNTANLNFQIFNATGTSLINATGVADLDGAVIDLALMGGFTPSVGATFDLLKASNFGSTGTGTTQNVGTGMGFTLAADDAGIFSLAVVTSGASKILRATFLGSAGVQGDYNNNGVVDMADYVLWKNGGPMQNDPTPGVQPADYTFWKAHFGAHAGSGSALGSGAAVPEPSVGLLFAIGAVLGGIGRSKRQD